MNWMGGANKRLKGLKENGKTPRAFFDKKKAPSVTDKSVVGISKESQIQDEAIFSQRVYTGHDACHSDFVPIRSFDLLRV